jgi:hypothetical protein
MKEIKTNNLNEIIQNQAENIKNEKNENSNQNENKVESAEIENPSDSEKNIVEKEKKAKHKSKQVEKETISNNSEKNQKQIRQSYLCLLYTSPSPRDGLLSRMPSSA